MQSERCMMVEKRTREQKNGADRSYLYVVRGRKERSWRFEMVGVLTHRRKRLSRRLNPIVPVSPWTTTKRRGARTISGIMAFVPFRLCNHSRKIIVHARWTVHPLSSRRLPSNFLVPTCSVDYALTMHRKIKRQTRPRVYFISIDPRKCLIVPLFNKWQLIMPS